MNIRPENLGREIYTKLSSEEGNKNREDEFAELFRRAVIGYGILVLVWPLVTSGVGMFPLDFGIYGTSIILAGSIFYGIGTLTGLPEFKNMDQVKQQVMSYIGFALISGGSIFLLSNELSAEFFRNAPEITMIGQITSPELASQVANFGYYSITFIAALLVPLFMGMIVIYSIASEQPSS